MAKYRVEFDHKEIRSVRQTDQTTPASDNVSEETTGEKLWAIIEAGSDNEARQKASRLQTELQTRKTKRDLRNEGDPNRERE
jgi:hypothetical protein